MTRPNKSEYLRRASQYNYDEVINKYYSELEKYCDFLEKYKPIEVKIYDKKCHAGAGSYCQKLDVKILLLGLPPAVSEKCEGCMHLY